MEIVGEFLGCQGDKAIWEYFRRHWVGWFPGLGDRTNFSRQAANLWWVKQPLQARLVAELGATTETCHVRDGFQAVLDGDLDPFETCHVRDGFPIAVCKVARAVRRQVLKPEAAYGYCAAKDEYYYGLKGHVVIDLRGVVTGMTVTAANVDEREAAYDILTAIEGLLIGDKGYIRPPFKADCEALGIDLQTPVRKNMKETRPRWFRRLAPRVRKRVETVKGFPYGI